MLDKTYARHWLCWTKPIPGTGYDGQNLFTAQVMLDKTYSQHRSCWTKPVPGIDYVGKPHMGLKRKNLKTGCFPSKKIPKLNNSLF